jgi:hypothetical protein
MVEWGSKISVSRGQVGFSRTISAVRWGGVWHPLPAFLSWPGAKDEWREVPRELCRERAMLQLVIFNPQACSFSTLNPAHKAPQPAS